MTRFEDLMRHHRRLTVLHLEQWIARGLLRVSPPERPANELEFGAVDAARIGLLYELSEDLAFDDDTLETIVGLVDRLNAVQRRFDALARAVAAQPPALQQAIARELRRDWTD